MSVPSSEIHTSLGSRRRPDRVAVAVGLIMLAWQAAALADSPTSNVYTNPPGEGPRLVGLRGFPIHVKTLCNSNELVAFSCSFPNKKMVSLCASPDIGEDSGYMQYRFGRSRSSIELEYPKQKVLPQTYFKQIWQQAQLGYASAISFWVGSYRYSLFLTKTRWEPALAGVVVDRDGKLVSFNQCINKTVAMAQANIGSPVNGLGFPGLPDAGDDISFAQLESVTSSGLEGVQAISIGSATRPPRPSTAVPAAGNDSGAVTQ